MKDLLNQIYPIAVTGVVGILAVIIKSIGDAVEELIASKKDEIVQKITQGKHEQQLKTAFEVWGIVDEHFRISQNISNVIEQKVQMFNDMLLQKVPGLSQDQLDYLRQTVAGEINKNKQAIQDDVVKQLQNQIALQVQQIQEQQNTIATLSQKLNTVKVAAQ